MLSIAAQRRLSAVALIPRGLSSGVVAIAAPAGGGGGEVAVVGQARWRWVGLGALTAGPGNAT